MVIFPQSVALFDTTQEHTSPGMLSSLSLTPYKGSWVDRGPEIVPQLKWNIDIEGLSSQTDNESKFCVFFSKFCLN